MLIINFEGREAKGLSKGRYDETFAGEDAEIVTKRIRFSLYFSQLCILLHNIIVS